MGNRDREWDFHLRSLSNSARDSSLANDTASDPSLLQSVKKLFELCKAENSEDLVARVYPNINKLFQRAVASLSQQSRTSIGLLLLAILQFYIDFGEVVLHDADPSLRAFFRSCLSREFSDPVVAEATLDFLNMNKKKLLTSFPTLLPQFFPLLLKLIAWNGERLEKSFLKVFPGLMSPGSFLPLFPSLVDLPILVVALEKVERSSGSLIGSSIASIQKSAAPEMLLALMDEAYTGSTIGDGGGDSESEDSNTIDVADPLFLDFLKDENDGIAERHWTSPGMATALQAAINTPHSERLKQILKMAPRILDVYIAITLRDVNNSLICALISLLMSRHATIFPDKRFSYEVHKRLLEFMLAAFHRSPDFIALLKKPIMDRLGATASASRLGSDGSFSAQLSHSKGKNNNKGGGGGNDGGMGGFFGPGGEFNIPGFGKGWGGNGAGGGYGGGYGGPSGGHSKGGVISTTVVCKEKGPCYNKKLTCPSKCFTSYSRSGKGYGGGGGGGGCTIDCKKKCIGYC